MKPSDDRMKLDPQSIQLRSTVDQLMTVLLGSHQKRGPRISAVVFVEEGENTETAAGRTTIDILPTQQDEDSADRLAVLLHTTIPHDHGPDGNVAERVSCIQAALDHVACHLWILSTAEHSLRLQTNDIHELSFSGHGIGSARNERVLRRVWRERAYYLRVLEGIWSFGTRMPAEVRALVDDVDAVAGIRSNWADCERRLASLGEAFSSFLDLPSIPEGPPNPRDRDAQALPALREKNVFKQAVRLVQFWHQPARSSSGRRRIELHPFTNRDAMFQELQASLTVTTLMTATAGIILGIVLGNRIGGSALSSTDAAFIRPYDVVFLFISTFAFFFATMVCANAAGQLARRSTSGIELEIDRAEAVTEYLGKYTFLIGLPMSVLRFVSPQNQNVAHATDRYVVCAVVILLAVTVLGVYNRREGIALISREVGDEGFGSRRLRTIISWAIPLIALLLFVTALRHPWLPLPLWLELPAAVTLLAIFVSLTLASALLPGKSNDRYFEVDDWDAMGAERQSWTDDEWRQIQEERVGTHANRH